MAWLARSIANSLRIEDNDDNYSTDAAAKGSPSKPESQDDWHNQIGAPSSSGATHKGVKEDFSEITKTLTRQFWGVASFLAPPPGSVGADPISDREASGEVHQKEREAAEGTEDAEVSDEAVIAGIRSDFAEISGKFKTGISKLSSNMAVSEFSKIASNFLQFGTEEENLEKFKADGVVGLTEEVLTFASNIAMHPETWLDFPLPENEEFDDFDMSDTQQEHALAVERLAPRLAALRIELCPGYMSEGWFWKIYFVLVHPRLSKHDAELLSTPEITAARAILTQQLQGPSKTKQESNWSGLDMYANKNSGSPHAEHISVPSEDRFESISLKTSSNEQPPSTIVADVETDKHLVQSTENQIIDKSVVKEEVIDDTKHHQYSQSRSSSKAWDEKYEDDADDDWLKEEISETAVVGRTTMSLGNDEDVSFSDLEEDEDVPTSYKKVVYGSDSSAKDSREWVQLNSSTSESVKDVDSGDIKHPGTEQLGASMPETKESSDWLSLDDIDVM